MWRTSCGRRTLDGAEAKVFATALQNLLEWVVQTRKEQFDLRPKCFNDLTYGQKVAALCMVGRGLLTADAPVVELTADLEGTIAAVFENLHGQLEAELEERGGQDMRRMIVAARREMEGAKIPDPACTDEEKWQEEIQILRDAVLFDDEDYELTSTFKGLDGEKAAEMKEFLAVDDRYFGDTVYDLRGSEIRARLRELRALLRTVL